MDNEKLFSKILDTLEELDIIQYSRRGKVTREIIIAAFSQYTIQPFEHLGYKNTGGLSTAFKKVIVEDLHKPISRSWRSHLLFLFGYKYCLKCKKVKFLKDFNKATKSLDHKRSSCRDCDATYNKAYKNTTSYIEYQKEYKSKNRNKFSYYEANRRAAKLERTPAWMDKEAIISFYNNCPAGYHVDHIDPLQGKIVSGLHVLNNLQYLSAKDNHTKSNTYESSTKLGFIKCQPSSNKFGEYGLYII